MFYYKHIQNPDIDIVQYLENNEISEYSIHDIKAENSWELQIDLDQGGLNEKVYLNKNDEGHTKFGIDFNPQIHNKIFPSNRGLQFLDLNASLRYAIHKADFTDSDDIQKIAFADINRDGVLDILCENHGTNPSLEIYISKGPSQGSFDQLSTPPHFESPFQGVPEYERSGKIYLSPGFVPDEERIFTNLITIENLDSDIPQDLKDILPEEFSLGGHRYGIPTISEYYFFYYTVEKTSQRLRNLGLDVEYYPHEYWIQDHLEFGTNQSSTSLENRVLLDSLYATHNPFFQNTPKETVEQMYKSLTANSGNITYARNKFGTLYVTYTPYFSNDPLNSLEIGWFDINNQRLFSFDDFAKSFANHFGADNLLILPSGPFAHSDQVYFFMADGKYLRIQVDEEFYPEFSQQLNDNDKVLAAQGFKKAGEINIPINFVKMKKSPLNIIVRENPETGRPQYIIPNDPIILYNSNSGQFWDFRDSSIDAMAEMILLQNQKRSLADYYWFYDNETPWSFVLETKKILMAEGVPEEDIVIFNHNGLGAGSLHCISSLQVLPE